jgi:hypothetical protein
MLFRSNTRRGVLAKNLRASKSTVSAFNRVYAARATVNVLTARITRDQSSLGL